VDDLRYLALGQADCDGEPWTDSDLANLEDPLPPSPAKPQPAYLSRRQAPGEPGDGDRRVPPAEDVWADTEIPYQPKELGVVDQLLLLLADGVALGKKGLRWVRSQLPADLQRQLSDEVLAAIILGLLVLGLALWNPLGAKGGVASEPLSSEPLPRITAAAPDDLDSFAAGPATARSPEPVASPPTPEPTAEQSLIADIQARVSRLSRSYGAGLIQSVEVNLPQSTLGVNVAEAWYGLLPQQQDEIAQDIYAQAQGLTLGRLQLRDPDGVVVARNPVVGPTMVVLKRLRQPGLDSGPAGSDSEMQG
jgi:hypothetical protein